MNWCYCCCVQFTGIVVAHAKLCLLWPATWQAAVYAVGCISCYLYDCQACARQHGGDQWLWQVCGLYVSCVPAPMQGANLWYSLHNRCIQQDTLNIIACPDSGRCLELLFAVHNNIACFDAGLQFASAGLWHLCCQECIQPELALITCMSEHVETMDCVWLFVTCSSMQKKLSLMCTAAGLDYNLRVATGDTRNSSNTSGVLAGARKDT